MFKQDVISKIFVEMRLHNRDILTKFDKCIIYSVADLHNNILGVHLPRR